VRFLLLIAVGSSACAFDPHGTSRTTPRDSAVAIDTALGELDTAVDEPETAIVEDTAPDVETKDPAPIFDSSMTLPGCSSTFRDGHEYLFCENDANWDQARTTCQIVGFDLVVINDKAEHDFIVAGIKTKSKNDWHIGVTDRAEEGKFVWVDGSKPAYTSWATFQPDNFWFSEDCVVLRRDATWNDIDCTGGPHEAFVCESL
jgi:hypothetical protein